MEIRYTARLEIAFPVPNDILFPYGTWIYCWLFNNSPLSVSVSLVEMSCLLKLTIRKPVKTNGSTSTWTSSKWSCLFCYFLPCGAVQITLVSCYWAFKKDLKYKKIPLSVYNKKKPILKTNSLYSEHLCIWKSEFARNLLYRMRQHTFLFKMRASQPSDVAEC